MEEGRGGIGERRREWGRCLPLGVLEVAAEVGGVVDFVLEHLRN